MKFRTKVVEKEAAQVEVLLHCAAHDWAGLPVWAKDAYEAGKVLFLPDSVEIKTPEGTMQGRRGDWIICGLSGELYPCKPDIFEKTYEPVI